MNNYLGGNGPVEMLPVIYQEVLQGMRTDTDKEYRRFQQNVQQFDFYHFSNQFEATSIYRKCRQKGVTIRKPNDCLIATRNKFEATSIYRKCRQKGVTIRKPNDCLIAHYCLSYNLSLLTIDGDFDHLAKVFSLQIVKI